MAGMKKRKSLDSTSKKPRKKHVDDTPPPADDVTSENEDSPALLQSCSNKDDDSSPESAFHRHLGYTLKDEEVDKLNDMDWKYKWKMAATGVPMSHWMGTGKNVLKDVSSDETCGLKPKLYDHWLDINKTTNSGDGKLSKREFFLLCSSYQDILHCNKKPFYHRGRDEDSSFMDAYILHALNHVYHTRELVTKNDSKLTKHQESTTEDNLSGDNFLDQGFTRPKIRGVKNIIFYSLPERKEFFPEITDMLEGSKDMVCRILYSRFDLLSLQKIVGTDYAKKILSSDKGMFVCTS